MNLSPTSAKTVGDQLQLPFGPLRMTVIAGVPALPFLAAQAMLFLA
jgi:hypothetical protein